MCKLRRITYKLSKAKGCEGFAGIHTSIKSTKVIIHSLQFQLCHRRLIFVDSTAHFRSHQKENSSEIPAHGSYRSVKLFLQPVKLSITMRSWNHNAMKSKPRHEKTCLRGFQPGKTQIGLLSYRDQLES